MIKYRPIKQASIPFKGNTPILTGENTSTHHCYPAQCAWAEVKVYSQINSPIKMCKKIVFQIYYIY